MNLRQTGCGESPDGRYTMPPDNAGAAAREPCGGSDAQHLRNGSDEILVGGRPQPNGSRRRASSRVHPVCLSNRY